MSANTARVDPGAGRGPSGASGAAVSQSESRTGQLSSLAGLLRAARQHGREPGLSAQVDLFPEDYPRLTAGPPRALSEVVMAQLEHPDNLARFADPHGRLLARILMNTGLRVGDGCRLKLDCIIHDGQGAPYLRYNNHKMRRDAFGPIDTPTSPRRSPSNSR